MFSRFRTQGLWIVFLLSLMAFIYRLLPHPANFAPVGALVLFSSYLSREQKSRLWLFPLLAMAFSDLILGMDFTFIFVYAGLWGGFVSSRLILRSFSYLRLGCAAILSALVFFLVSNAGVWLLSGMYSPDLQGLMHSYLAGIPFFRWSLLGDLSFGFGFIGLYRWIHHPKALASSKQYT